MSSIGQMMCSVCGEPFEKGDVIVTFRVWPEHERVGHAACVVSLSIEDSDEEDEEDG
jgi:hypothetical protein